MYELKCWKHEQLRERLWVVHEEIGHSCYNIFVVPGEKNVGIFDAGMGFRTGLREYIEENITGTGRPMYCYCTHGDIDHIGSAITFDACYLNHADVPALKYHASCGRLFHETARELQGDEQAMAYIRENYVHNEKLAETVQDLPDGMRIDLGGTALTVYRLPGHTAGAVAFVNEAEHYVLIGDSALPTSSWGRCEDLRDCLESHTRLMEALPEDAVVYNSHGYEHTDMAMLRDLRQAFEDILACRCENDEPIVLEFLKFVPRELMEPAEYTHALWVHKVGKAVVPYNANVVPGREFRMNIAGLLDGLQHIGIPTADMAATEEFYTSLGFEKQYETLNGGSKVCFFRLGSVVIEAYEGVAAGHAGAIDHIALDVWELDPVYAQAKRGGYHIVSNGIEELPFFEKGIRFFIIAGPNGERVEFNQINR